MSSRILACDRGCLAGFLAGGVQDEGLPRPGVGAAAGTE